jgi:hypothetical protein
VSGGRIESGAHAGRGAHRLFPFIAPSTGNLGGSAARVSQIDRYVRRDAGAPMSSSWTSPSSGTYFLPSQDLGGILSEGCQMRMRPTLGFGHRSTHAGQPIR